MDQGEVVLHVVPQILLLAVLETGGTFAFLQFSARSCSSSPLAGSLIICVKKLLVTHFRNLLDYLCLAVLSLQHTLGWFNSPKKTRAYKSEASSSCLKKASSACSSSSRRFVETPITTFHTLVCILICLVHQRKRSINPAGLLHEGQLSLLTFPVWSS